MYSLWTSSLQRTIQTAQFIKQEKILVEEEETGAMIEWVQMKPRYTICFSLITTRRFNFSSEYGITWTNYLLDLAMV